MADIAQLGIAVDTSQTKIAARELDNLASAGGRAEASTKKLESTARKSMADIAAATQRGQQAMERMAAAQERQEKLMEQMARQMNEFTRATNAGAGATNAMAQASNNAAQALGKQSAAARDAQASIGEMTGRLLATVAAVVSLNDAVSRMDAWTVMNNRLKLVTDTQTQFAQAQSNIIGIANSTQQPLSETAQLYQRLASSQKTLGLSGTELAGIIKTISQSMVVGGASAAGGAAALMQLGQAFNSGVLRGEEFNSVMEQAPGLMQALAAGMGKTVGEMRALAEAGKITTQEIVKALQNQSASVQSSFDKMNGTIGGAMNVASNNLTEFIGRMNDATGASGVLAGAITGVANNIGPLATMTATLAAVGLATWFTSAATAAGGFAVAATAVGTAMKGLMVSMGPAGWLILALGTAATAWQLFGDKAQTAGRQTETASDKANAAANKLVAGIVPAINTAIAAYDKMIEKQKQAAGTAATPIQQAATGLKEADLNLQRLAQQAARAQQGIGEYAKMSAADRMKAEKAVTAELEKASLKRAELAKKEAEYNSGVVSAYVKGKERQTDASARLLQIEEAKGKRDAALAAAGNDRAKQEAVNAAYRVELAKIDESYAKKGASAKTAAVRAAKAALKDETDAMSDLAGVSSTYYKDLANYQKQRASGNLTEADYIKLVEQLIQKQPFAIKLAKEQADAWKEQEKARKEAYDANVKAYEDETKAAERSAQQVTDRVTQIQIENEAADIAAATNVSLAQAIEQVMIARLEEQAVIARDEGKQEVLDALNAEIEARKQLASVTGQKEVREANAKAAKDAAEEWKRTADKIEDSLIDALMNGGKSGAEYIEGLFRSMVLRPVLQAIVSPVAGAVTSALGFSGAAQAGQGSGLGGIQSLQGAYNALTTGIRSSIASGFEKLVSNDIGQKLSLSYYDGNAYQTTALGEQFRGFTQGVGSSMTAYGLQKAISNGYETGEKGLVDLATTIGGYFDPTGGLIAGTIGGTINRAFGRKLKDQGLEGTFGGADGFDGNSYEFYEGGWFRSDKTKRKALDADVEDALETQFKALQIQTAMMAQTLGLSTDSVANFTAKIKVSFKDLNEEQISQRMAEEFGKVAESMASAALGTTDYTRTGETAVETLTRLSSSLTTVNGTFDVLGQTLYASSLAGADMASQLVDLMGGQEAFINTTAAYYANFYTEAERADVATRQLTAALATIGVDAMPASREAFRDLVEAQDLTTESGRATYAGLLGVSGAFAALVPATEVAANSIEAIDQAYQRLTNITLTAEQAAQQRIDLEGQLLQLQGDTAAIRERELASIDPSNQALQQRIWALEDEAQAASQRIDLEGQLLQLQGDTVAIRERELASIDPSNRALKERIWALEDERAAATAAQAAHQSMIDMIGLSADTLSGLFKNVLAEASSAEEARKLGEEAASGMIAEAIANTMVGTVSNLVSTAILQPMTTQLVSAASAAAGMDVAASATSATALTTGATTAGTTIAAGGAAAAGALDSVVAQAVSAARSMAEVLQDVSFQDAMADVVDAIGEISESLYTTVSSTQEVATSLESVSTSIAEAARQFRDITEFDLSKALIDAMDIDHYINRASESARSALEKYPVAEVDWGVFDQYKQWHDKLLEANQEMQDLELGRLPDAANSTYAEIQSRIRQALKILHELGPQIGGSASSLIESISASASDLGDAFSELAQAAYVGENETPFDALNRYIAGFSKDSQTAAGMISQTAGYFSDLSDGIASVMEAVDAVGAGRLEFEPGDWAGQYFAENSDLFALIGEAAGRFSDTIIETIAGDTIAALESNPILDSLTGENLQSLGIVISQVTEGAIPQLVAAFDTLNVALASGAITAEQYDALVETTLGQFKGANDAAKAIETVAEAYKRLTNVVKTNADIAQEQIDLEERLFNATATTAELRRRELDALDPANRALQQMIWTLEDAKVATADALQAAEKAISKEKDLVQKASDERMKVLQSQLAAAQKLSGVEQVALQMLGNTTMLRERELAAMDLASAALQNMVWSVEDASNAMDRALAKVQRSINAERERITTTAQDQIKAIEAEIDARQQSIADAQKSVSDLQGVFDGITDAVKTLRGNVLTEQQNLEQARAYIDMSLSVARAGGDVNQERLQAAMQTVVGDSADLYTSGAEYRYQQARQANVLDALGGIIGGRVGSAQTQLEALNSANTLAQDQIKAINEARDAQIKSLDAQLKAAEDAVATVKGVDLSVVAVGESLTELGDSIENYEYARDTLARQSLQTGFDMVQAIEDSIENETASTAAMLVVLDNQLLEAQNQVAAINGVKTSVLSVEEAISGLAFAISNQQSASTAAEQTLVPVDDDALPSFDVGTNYVPRDMVAKIHQGEAIVPREFNPAIFNPGNASNGELVKLVAALTEEVKRLQGIVQEGNREQRRTANAVNGQSEAPMLVEAV